MDLEDDEAYMYVISWTYVLLAAANKQNCYLMWNLITIRGSWCPFHIHHNVYFWNFWWHFFNKYYPGGNKSVETVGNAMVDQKHTKTYTNKITDLVL